MHYISKSAIVPYSCGQMYQLVNQINEYPQFLNWCNSACILNQTDTQITASIAISKSVFNQTFTTINTLTPNTRIDMQLKDGPFKQLSGAWVFTALNNNACKINFKLEFSFSSKLLDTTLSSVFTSIANLQLDAFITRAKQVYG